MRVGQIKERRKGGHTLSLRDYCELVDPIPLATSWD